MPTINQVMPSEKRRNLTESQRKNETLTQEGVVVNSFIKDNKDINMNDVYDSMVISNNVKMPQKLYEAKEAKEVNLLPLSLISLGVMSAMTLVAFFIKKNARVNAEMSDMAKKLTPMQRNLAVNEETHQALYQMVQSPNQKTILAGVGVLTISAMAFMGKMFIDGFKEVWVKRKEADIKKNLQEKLIAVETQSFSGKMQIIRSLLSEKANEFSEYLCNEPSIPLVFKSFDSHLQFKGRNAEEKKQNSLRYFAMGALTLGSIIGLGFLSMKNLGASKKYLEKTIKNTQHRIKDFISNMASNPSEADKIYLKNLFLSIDATPEYAKHELGNLKWEKSSHEKFVEDIIFDLRKSTAQADKAMAGDGIQKPSFYSHVNDYRAFFYNYLLDTSNPSFKNLFFGITGLTAFTYGGKILGEAVKEVQVKKYNAQTDLDLEKRLVATELRNFKAKKDAAINPLCEEFYLQLQKGKPKEELKTIAENILFEVKNGPPFVYS